MLRYRANPEPALARMKRGRAEGKGATAEYQRAWKAKNPDRQTSYNARYYAKNRQAEIDRSLAYSKANPHVDRAIWQRREARKRNAICGHGPRCVTAAFLKAVYAAPCTYCGGKATEADHYKPLARGGLHCRDNIVPACKTCNCSKHAKDPEEWLASRSLLADQVI